MTGHTIVSHGFEATPEGVKAVACAAVAQAIGWTVQRPDYQAYDARREASRLGDVEGRIAHLRAIAEACSTPPVLCGSSLGAFVSARVSLEVPVAGLFLMAPPVWLEDYDFALQSARVPTVVVHGWRDELIPAAWVAAWAQARDLRAIFVPDTHRLEGHVDFIAGQFGRFLESLR